MVVAISGHGRCHCHCHDWGHGLMVSWVIAMIGVLVYTIGVLLYTVGQASFYGRVSITGRSYK